MSATLNACLDFFVPPRCINCSCIIAHQTGMCAKCWRAVQFIERPYCAIMGTPFSVELGEGIVGADAIANPPPFARLRSAVIYNDIARQLISKYKFSDRNDFAPFIAATMARAGRELINDADVIIALPLHWRRLLSRRFNQSAELARLIAKNHNVSFMPLALERLRNTPQQIGLSQEGRHNNVAGAFKVPAASRPHLTGKRVLLVDDVYTSGASVKSATKALLRGGAMNVDVLTFAKVHASAI